MRLLTICAAGLLALEIAVPDAYCQASFRFQNLDVSVDAPVFDASGVALAGTNYLAGLYGSNTPDSLTPASPVTAVPFFTGIGAGYFQAPYYLLIPNVAGGSYAWLQVRAWDARLGATYEEVAALGIGGYGESEIFSALGGDPSAVPPFGPQALLGLQSFSLRAVVPEPSTWALLAPGGMIFWRELRRRHS